MKSDGINSVATGAPLDTVLALGRENKRRAVLHRQIGGLERGLERVMRDKPFKWPQRSARIVACIKAKKFELDQMELPL